MIVKIIPREQDVTIWNENGDRIYYSADQKDIDFAKNLVASYKTPYYAACWRNKIVAIKKPVTGYEW